MQHNQKYFGCFISFCFTFHYSKSYFFGLGTTTLTPTSSARATRDPRAPSTTPPRPSIALGTIGSRGLSAPRASGAKYSNYTRRIGTKKKEDLCRCIWKQLKLIYVVILYVFKTWWIYTC
jgi:hypothetical protein